jgi:hypothetical protein
MGGANNEFNKLGGTLLQATGLAENPALKEDKRLTRGAAEAQRALLGVATGKAPAISEMQYAQALEQAAAAQQAAAASARGVNPALAFRGAQMATENAQTQT